MRKKERAKPFRIEEDWFGCIIGMAIVVAIMLFI